MTQRRGDQVFQLSLTELAFSIAFLLLMLLGVRVAQSQAERDAARAALANAPAASQAEAALERAHAALAGALQGAGAADPSATLSRLVDAEQARAERDRLRSQVADLDARLSALQALRAHDEALHPALGGLSGLAASQSVLGGSAPGGGTQAGTSDEAASGTARAVSDLRGQVAYLTRRLAALPGHGGRDYPPCWADAAGHVEFLLDVELRPGALVLRPAWPPARDAQAHDLPGLAQLVAGPLSAEQFVARVQPLADWSHARTPECRHYVSLRSTIADAVQSDRERLLVERYFYKTELPR